MREDNPLCVFVSLEDPTGHEIDDHLCEPIFAQHGWRLESWPWTSEKPWHEADLIVLRSCYDYWQRPDRFNEFLMRLESQRLKVLNHPRLVRWNSSKRYLIHLGGMGIPVVPSLVLDDKTMPGDLPDFLAAHPGISEFVVKPLIGSGGFEIEKLAREDLVRRSFSREVIVQPFLAEIHEGEWSAIFLNGEASHPVVKEAAEGEYRVQDSHGGRTRGISWQDQPTLKEHALQVQEAMKTLALPLPCYARYDFIEGAQAGQLLLMEVEVIEPTLFLTHDQEAPKRFVDAILGYPHDL
jgi:glutathione synthase/RimK-type ligase-like ATP-grasp enzyme